MLFTGRTVEFPTKEAKAAFMEREAQRDAADPAVRWWAAHFLPVPPQHRAAAILRFCQWCIAYTHDPKGREVLDSAAVGLVRGYGDCDLKTRVFVALCLASGISAHTDPVYRGDTFPHVRAEVWDGGTWKKADPSILNSSIGVLPRHPITTFEGARLLW